MRSIKTVCVFSTFHKIDNDPSAWMPEVLFIQVFSKYNILLFDLFKWIHVGSPERLIAVIILGRGKASLH